MFKLLYGLFTIYIGSYAMFFINLHEALQQKIL